MTLALSCKFRFFFHCISPESLSFITFPIYFLFLCVCVCFLSLVFSFLWLCMANEDVKTADSDAVAMMNGLSLY